MYICAQILSFILGLLAAFVVSISIIYWQFTRSTAGYRLKMVVNATQKLIKEVKSSNPYTGLFRNKYRYSLGVILDRLINTFGTKDILKQSDKYPCLLAFGKEDRWNTFNIYIRPVIEDINQYSFIGWLPFIPKEQWGQAQLFDFLSDKNNILWWN